ncbi:MAG: response regulator transcription factor [Anaerolineales bacterium]
MFHILLIEDDPAIAQSLQDALKLEGYTVTWKSTGQEGVRIAKERLPQLILLDVRLPDGSGFDFCRQLRQAGCRQPIIMLTAQQEAMDKVLGLEMGADDYVTKPFNLRELFSRIRAHLRRAYGEYAQPNANVIAMGDVVLDMNQGQAFRGPRSLNLTPTEYRLLVFLAQNRGIALTRPQIIDAVWGYAPDLEEERTINVYIRRLREKIELDASKPALILTVPGIGYRLAG